LVCFGISLWLSVSSHASKHEGWLSPGKMTNLVGNVLLFITITAVSSIFCIMVALSIDYGQQWCLEVVRGFEGFIHQIADPSGSTMYFLNLSASTYVAKAALLLVEVVISDVIIVSRFQYKFLRDMRG
jgi:hypothetical protein